MAIAIRSPTACGCRRRCRSRASRSSLPIRCPSVPAAVTAPQTMTCSRSRPGPASVGPNWSNGQIFIAVMPWREQVRGEFPRLGRRARRRGRDISRSRRRCCRSGCGPGCARPASRRSAARQSGPSRSQSAVSSAEIARISAPIAPQKLTSANMFCQWFSMSRGSRPRSSGARMSWMIAATARGR